MNALPESLERRSVLSDYEIIQTILALGMHSFALVGLVITITKKDKK